MRNTWVFWAKSGLVCLLIIAGAMINTGSVAAQSGDPSTLPLLSSDGLQYVGGFRLPANSSNGTDFSFGGQPMAHNPATNGLFVGSYYGALAEVNIPTPVNSSDVNALPFASYMQPFADPTEGHLSEVTTSGVMTEGLLVMGSRLYGTAAIFYDADNNQRVSHYSRSVQLNQPSFSGWSQVSEPGRSGFVSGWMTAVPSEWQAKLGGPALTGQCCIPIVWRTSVGPSAFAINPAQIGQPQVSASPLMYYTGEHATLGPWEGSNPTYGATTFMSGMVLVSGTRTVLYVGRNGLGPHCYGNGTPNKSLEGTYGTDGAMLCYDPASSDKGSHAYPYRYQVWAYDLNDFAAVKAGTKQPWEVVPYGVWPISFPTFEGTFRLGGVAYDAQRQTLYIAQRGADLDGYAYRPVIHAFRLNAAPGSVTGSNLVSNVTLTTDKAAPQSVGASVVFTAQPSGGVGPYQYKWIVSDGSTSTVAATWGVSNKFTWTPSTQNANYRVSVWVRSSGNTADALEASSSIVFPVTSGSAAATAVSLTANRVAPQAPMTAVTWTATPVGGVAPHQYKFRVFDGSTWTIGASWSPANSFVWTPSTANANYRVEVWVRSAGNTADVQEASTATAFGIAAGTARVSSVSLTANKPSPQALGTTITWTAAPSGGSGPFLYKWWVAENNAGNTWATIGDWTSNSTLVWTPSVENPTYRIAVWVKSASNPVDESEAGYDLPYSITAGTSAPTQPAPTPAPKPVSVSLSADKAAPQTVGMTVNFTAVPAGGTAPFLYKWFVSDGSSWNVVGSWTSSNRFTWSPASANANYRIRVWVKNSINTNDQAEVSSEQPFAINAAPTVQPPTTVPGATTPVSAVSLSVNKPSPQPVGSTIMVTATPSGSTGPLLYKWWVAENGAGNTWNAIGGWTSSPTLAWTPSNANPTYHIAVWVKRASNPADQAEASNEVRYNISKK